MVSFHTKTLYAPLASPIRATCTAHFIILDFITWIISDEQHRSLSSQLRTLLKSPVTSSLLGPNILLINLLSNTVNQRSSLNVSDQVSHPDKTTEKIIVMYILIFKLLDSKPEDKIFCTKWQQAFPDFNQPLISSWMDFWYVTVVPKHLNFSNLLQAMKSQRLSRGIPLPFLWPRP